jgi:hypothetical protein
VRRTAAEDIGNRNTDTSGDANTGNTNVGAGNGTAGTPHAKGSRGRKRPLLEFLQATWDKVKDAIEGRSFLRSNATRGELMAY